MLNYYTETLKPLNKLLLDISAPIYSFANLPKTAENWAQGRAKSRDDLLVENAKLASENLVLQGKLQKFTALAIENVRLRELLNASALLEQQVLVAEVVSVSPDPKVHEVVINKGLGNDVYVGQAVIDASGLLGQVIAVSDKFARVLLISDNRHGVPVQINRNGLRLVAEGNNDYERLTLPYVALTTDVKTGDILSSSGLGGVFPAGYPVAKVVEVTQHQGEAFASVYAKPFAKLRRARYVLLLFSKPRTNS